MLRKNHPHKDQIQRLIPISDKGPASVSACLPLTSLFTARCAILFLVLSLSSMIGFGSLYTPAQ
jgi:hypothetical protein